ncbi:antibiotic biosynthesis monooxygenase family protein [Rhodococcus sp. NPDC019627]|uniref:antibiotic biosynthesis monooxygenase family protein n=1 Tax=unclassified Rhodococcus (in: high G+C Gram-positive bacteria) TaxID=192944 RepID=UPI0033D52E57
MISEHVEIQLEPGAGRDLEAAFDEIRALLLAAPGCTEATLSRSVDRAETYLLRALWNRLEDHTEVFAVSPAGTRVRKLIQPLCSAAPRVTHYEH